MLLMTGHRTLTLAGTIVNHLTYNDLMTLLDNNLESMFT